MKLDGKLNILLLEDTPSDARLILHQIKKAGIPFEGTVVDNKSDYQRTLKEQKKDLIITDFNLPDLTGAEALEIAKRHDKNIPVIVVSGTLSKEMEVELLEGKADDVVLKSHLGKISFATKRALNEAYFKKLIQDNYRYQEVLSEISVMFNSQIDFDEKIQFTLATLGKTLDVSRTYIFEDFDEGKKTKNTFEWCANGVEPQIEMLQELSHKEDVPSFRPHLITNGKLFSNDVSQLPEDMREILEPQKIKAILIYPLYIDSKFFGFIGLDETRSTREWRDSADKLLKTVSGIIANAYKEKIIKEDLRANQETLREALKVKQTLLSEVHHRVKNNLAIISGLLELKQMSCENDEIKEVLNESILRIKSIALVHEKLYQHESLTHVDFTEYLDGFLKYVNMFFNNEREWINIHRNNFELILNLNQAVPVCLIISELITNAVKHGYEENDTGNIEVNISAENNVVTLMVCDDGRGLPDGFDIDDTSSFGLDIVKELVRQIEGKIETQNNGGCEFIISFKLSEKKGSSNALVA